MSSSQQQAQLDCSWFYSNPEQYLSSDAFSVLEDASGIFLNDFMSPDPSTLHITYDPNILRPSPLAIEVLEATKKILVRMHKKSLGIVL